MHKNAVIKCVQPIIDYLHNFHWRIDQENENSFEAIRQEVRSLYNDLIDCLPKAGIFEKKSDVVKYVIVVLVDDVINHSDWEFANTWINDSFEEEIYGLSDADILFYKYMKEDGETDPELAELFYISLLLGFNRNEDEVRDNKYRLYHILNLELGEDDRYLSPGANKFREGKTKILPPLFGFWTLIIILSVSSGLYIIVSQILWDNAVSLIQDTALFINNIGILE